MFEALKEIKRATVKQLIAIQTMNVIGCINWIDYGDNGTILVNWEDGDYGLPATFSVDKKGLVEYVKATSHFKNGNR